VSTLQVTPDRVVLRLSTTEKLAAVHGDLTVPRSAITGVELVEDGVGAARGLRAPGLGVPGRRKLGTWRSWTGRQFVDVRRAQPALRIELAPGQRYTRLLVGADDAAALAGELVRVPADERGGRNLALDFPSGAEHLAGTLTVPRGPGLFPAALLITGSGPLDRDGDTRRLPLGVSRTLARALAAAGVASLRYDKRGVGASSGTFLAAGLADNIADARSALAALSARPEVDPARLLLIGHSEGAIIATTLAADDPRLAGVVLLAGTARKGEDLLVWQAAQVAPTLPAPVRLLLRATRTDLVTKVRHNHARLRATTTDVARIGLVRVNAKWLREFLDHDPRKDLARIHAPVLAVTGNKDLQTPAEDLDAINALVQGQVTVVRPPDVTHLLRTEPGPASLRTYRKQARQPVADIVTRAVTDWAASLPIRATEEGA
jgi:pimeloyl-ACP methyl ester carboxylesterase